MTPTVDIRKVGPRDGLRIEHPIPTEAKLEFIESLVATGVHRIEVTSFVSSRAIPAPADADLGIHLHNTRGQGLANAWAAHGHGIRRFDASVGGLGGCPFAPGASGNIATEELVYLFEDGGITTGIDIDKALDAARLISHLLGKPADSNLLAAGGRAMPRSAARA